MAITTVNSYLTASGLNFRSGTTGAASLLLDPSSNKIHLSGNFDLGTGSFTIGGNPIVTGSSSSEGDTLQSVTDRGSSTTNAVSIGGALTLSNHIFKNVENSFLGLYGGSDTLTNDGFIKIYGDSSNWGKVQTNIGYSSTNSKAHWTLNNTTELMTLKGDGSLGIGTTNPSYKLEVKASDNNHFRTFDAGGSRFFELGDDGSSDENVFMNSQRGGFNFQCASSTKVHIHDDGKVGIGITSPSSMLDIHTAAESQIVTGLVIANNVATTSTAGNGVGIIMGRAGGVYSSKIANVWTNNNPSYLQTNIAFYTMHDSYAAGSETEKMRLTSQGRLGIGVTNPSERLEVNPDNDSSAILGRAHVGYIGHADYAGFSHVDKANSTSYSLLQSAGGDTFLNCANGYQIFFRYNNTTMGGFNASQDFYVDTDTLYVDASEDKVGIGITNPARNLTVASSSTNALIQLANSTTTYAADNGLEIFVSDNDAGIVNRENGYLRFDTNNIERVRISSAGNVGIGVTDPSTSRVRIKGGTSDSSTNALQCIDSSSTQMFYVRNDGVVAVDKNYFYVVSSAGAYVQHALRVRGSISNDSGPLVIGNSNGTNFDGDVNFDANTLFVDSSTNRIGIGTTNPQEELDLRGDMRLDSAGNTDRSIYFRNQSSIAKVRSDAALQFDVGVSSSPTAAMYIEEDTRDVGIGVTSPTSKLHIYGGNVTGLAGSLRNDSKNRMNMKVAMADVTRYIGTVTQYGNGDSAGFTIRIYDGGEKVFRIVRVVVQNSSGTNYPSITVEGGGEDTDIHIDLKYKNRDGDATKTDFFLDPTGTKYFNQYIEIEGFIFKETGYNTTSLSSCSLDTDLALNVLDHGNGSRVGIGTTDPSAKLHAEGSMIVKGDASWAGTDNQNGAIFMNTAGRGLKGAFSTSYARNLILANSNYIDLGDISSLVYGFRFYAGSTSSPVGTYDFFTSGTNSRLHIEKGGDVGIGTTNPTAQLHVHGPAGNLRVHSSAGGANIYLESQAGNASRVRWNGLEKFAIRDDADGADRLVITTDGNIVANDNKKFQGTTYSSSYLSFSDDTTLSANSDIIFDVNGSTELMRLEEGGNVGIGTTNPSTLLHLEASDPVLKIRDSSTTTAGATLWLQESDTYGVKINYQSNGGDHGRDFLTIDTLSAADSNNQAGNHDNAWGIDQDGYVMPHKGAVDGNLLKSYEWLLYGSQVSGSTPSFPRNGTEAENSRIYGNNPFGEPAILWYTPSQDSSDNDDGGWNSDTFIIDRGKSYRTSVWVKKTTTNTSDGNLYLGTSYVDNLNGTYNTNPYFIGGTTMASAGMENDQWYLMVGYIYDSGHTGTTNHPKGGIYDRNGKKLTSATSFKFTDSGSPSDGLSSNFNKSRQRVYNYYDATTGSKTYWWGPRFEPLEASTPTLQEVLNTPSSDTGAYFMGDVGIGTNSPLGTTHIYTADAGGTIATNASHDDLIIENNGNCGIQLSSPASSYQYLAFGDTASANQGYVRYYHASDRMDLRAGGTDTLSLVGGDVGIGTTGPASLLHVSSASSESELRIESDNGNGDPFIHFKLDAGSSYSMGIDDDDSNTFKISRNATLGTNDILKVDSTTAIVYNNLLVGEADGTLDGSRLEVWTTNSQSPFSITNTTNSNRKVLDSAFNSNHPRFSIFNASATETIRLETNGDSFFNGGNVGIGTTDPSAQYFNNLVVGNDAAGDKGITIRSNAGNKGVLAFSDTDSANAGRYDGYIAYGHTDNTMRFFTNAGNERMAIDNNGKVGIGTTSPADTLQVAGQVRIDGSTTDGLTITSNAGASRGFEIYNNSSTDTASLINYYDGPVLFGQNNAEKFRINTDGDLVIAGNGTSNDSFYIYFNNAACGLRRQANDLILGGYEAIRFRASNTIVGNQTERMCILDDGNVGIGTTNPAGKLQVYTSDNRHTKILGSTADFELVSDNNTNPVALIKGVGTADLLNVFDNTTEVFTILDGGNVGIGTTNPVAKLHVVGTARISAHTDLQSSVDISSKTRIYNKLGIGAGSSWVDPANGIDVYGSVAIGASYIGVTAPSDGAIIAGNVGIGSASPTTALDVNGDVTITNKLIHAGDTDTFLEFTNNTITLDAGGEEHIKIEAGGITINEGGQPNDFRIEGDGDTHLFFVDGSADKVGIGTNSPQSQLHVEGTVQTKVHTIGGLPSASPAGQRAMVSDSYYTFGSSTIGQTVYAGGSAVAPVYSDGSYWRYG